jgi:opacity protein-like surface antigen
MKKIVLSLAALAAVSSAALADSAFDKQLKRNMIEFPDHYAATVSGGYAAGDALAIDSDVTARWGNKRWAGPGEDGNHGR